MNDQNSNMQNNQPPIFNLGSNQNQIPPIYGSATKRLTDITKVGLILQVIISLPAFLLALVTAIAMTFNINGEPISGIDIDTISAIILIAIVGSIFLITLILSSVALSKKTHGIVLAAGIFGLLFTGIVPGIFTLVGNHD